MAVGSNVAVHASVKEDNDTHSVSLRAADHVDEAALAGGAAAHTLLIEPTAGEGFAQLFSSRVVDRVSPR